MAKRYRITNKNNAHVIVSLHEVFDLLAHNAFFPRFFFLF